MEFDTKRRLKLFFRNVFEIVGVIGGVIAFFTLLWLLPQPYDIILTSVIMILNIAFLAWIVAGWKLESLKYEEEKTMRNLSREKGTFL